jgi:hypothetical protein
MNWLDIAGLIIGLGVAAGVFILVIAWAYCLRWIVNETKNNVYLTKYIIYRKEFHQWRDEKREKQKQNEQRRNQLIELWMSETEKDDES